jgi:hypothetical protein
VTVIPIQCGKGEPISNANQTIAGGSDRFAHAWHALRSDPSVQFNLPPPPPAPQPPAWLRAFLNWLGDLLKPVGHFIGWLLSFLPGGPIAIILLWLVIILGALAIAWAIYSFLRYGEVRLRFPRRTVALPLEAEEEWVPDVAGARSWLEEADALAREGRYAEAIHHLLFRSVEDISNRRPALVRPALTSRELAAAQAIPVQARERFASIARAVERSLFGARRVGEREWHQAREAYSSFALPSAWRA